MQKREPLSPVRKRYILRLFLRVAVLIFCAVYLIHDPEQASILRGWNFFRRFSVFHILWLLWIVDMLWQLIPVQKNLHIALGSQKLFKFRFRPVKESPFIFARSSCLLSRTCRCIAPTAACSS